MRVKCIFGDLAVTSGRYYYVIEKIGNSYKVINDFKLESLVNCNNFITLKEHRLNIIKSI